MGHWLIDTAGVGSVIALVVALVVLAAYARVLQWIRSAPRDDADGGRPG